MAKVTIAKLTISELTQQAIMLHDHELLVKMCRWHLQELHCTLWMDWILDDDKALPDGTFKPGGFTRASEWLAKQIEAILDLTTRVK